MNSDGQRGGGVVRAEGVVVRHAAVKALHVGRDAVGGQEQTVVLKGQLKVAVGAKAAQVRPLHFQAIPSL